MNLQFLLKTAITVAVVLIASLLARRSGWLGALVASLPLTSLLVLGWLYADTRDTAQVADLSMGRAAGAGLIVAVLTGVGGRTDLAPLADAVIGSVAELEAGAAT